MRGAPETGAKPLAEVFVLALKSGELPCAEAMLKHSVGRGSEAIHTVARENRREILDRRLGIYPGKGLGPAMHGATGGCNFELTNEIMKMGADPDLKNSAGISFLMMARENRELTRTRMGRARLTRGRSGIHSVR